METGLLHLHNFMRWVVLITALIALFRGIGGLGGNKAFGKADKRAALFFMISCDIQLLLGLFLYFGKGWFNVLTSGGFMKLPAQRFWAMEHMLGMLIAIVLVHLGYSAVKKNVADKTKFSRWFWYSLVALLIIIATIPWPFRESVARGLFPGMSA